MDKSSESTKEIATPSVRIDSKNFQNGTTTTSSIEVSGEAEQELVSPISTPTKTEEKKQGPPEVQVWVHLNELGDVDVAKGTVEVQFGLHYRWIEPNLTLDEKHWWNPNVVINNTIELNELSSTDSITSPYIWRKKRYRGTIACDFKLHDFPFDTQLILLVLGEDRPGELKYVPWPGTEDSPAFHPRVARHPEFHIMGVKIVVEDHVTHGTPERRFSHFVYGLRIERRAAYFFSKIAFVFLLCLYCSWCSFFMDAESIGDRLSLITTLLLTSVAFQYVVNERLPVIPYLTKMDYFVNFCYALLLLNAIESGIVFRCYKAGYEEEMLDEIDLISFIILASLGLGLTLWFYYLKWEQEREHHEVISCEKCTCTDCKPPTPDYIPCTGGHAPGHAHAHNHKRRSKKKN